jgi:hypothetical protein
MANLLMNLSDSRTFLLALIIFDVDEVEEHGTLVVFEFEGIYYFVYFISKNFIN